MCWETLHTASVRSAPVSHAASWRLSLVPENPSYAGWQELARLNIPMALQVEVKYWWPDGGLLALFDQPNKPQMVQQSVRPGVGKAGFSGTS